MKMINTLILGPFSILQPVMKTTITICYVCLQTDGINSLVVHKWFANSIENESIFNISFGTKVFRISGCMLASFQGYRFLCGAFYTDCPCPISLKLFERDLWLHRVTDG